MSATFADIFLFVVLAFRNKVVYNSTEFHGKKEKDTDEENM